MRIVLLCCCFLFTTIRVLATNVDVVHYVIRIEQINFKDSTLTAESTCTLRLQEISSDKTTFSLSLASLTVDSVGCDSRIHYLGHSGENLTFGCDAGIPASDILTIRIRYHGHPAIDPGGWGGFYFRNGIAFNMGAGFTVEPHAFGRAWFPANDVFNDKATFNFEVTTSINEKAFCNGTLYNYEQLTEGRIRWYWRETVPITTYLATVTAGALKSDEWTVQGIPVLIAMPLKEKRSMRACFSRLDSLVQFYQQHYGPYPFEKIGYCLVPFDGGAMEHAGLISIGSSFVDADKESMLMWGHELAHMWFGNLVTCNAAAEMWLNEGFARMNEALMIEYFEGENAYLKECSIIHNKALSTLYTSDPPYVLADLPSAQTYSPYSYDKAADVLLTLRSWLGDSLFFHGIRNYLDHRKFGNATTADFFTDMEIVCGFSLKDFKEKWFYQKGMPILDYGMQVSYDGTVYRHALHVLQLGQTGNTAFALPLAIHYMSDEGDTVIHFHINSHDTLLVANLPRHFRQAWINQGIPTAFASNGFLQPITSNNDSYEDAGIFIDQVKDPQQGGIAEHLPYKPRITAHDSVTYSFPATGYWRIHLRHPQSVKALKFMTSRFKVEKRTEATTYVLLYRSDSWSNFIQVPLAYSKDETHKETLLETTAVSSGEYCIAVVRQ